MCYFLPERGPVHIRRLVKVIRDGFQCGKVYQTPGAYSRPDGWNDTAEHCKPLILNPAQGLYPEETEYLVKYPAGGGVVEEFPQVYDNKSRYDGWQIEDSPVE